MQKFGSKRSEKQDEDEEAEEKKMLRIMFQMVKRWILLKLNHKTHCYAYHELSNKEPLRRKKYILRSNKIQSIA